MIPFAQMYSAAEDHLYRCAFKKVRSVQLSLQSRFFQPLSKKFVINVESGVFSLRKAGFGHCKGLGNGFGENPSFKQVLPNVTPLITYWC